MGIDIDLLGPPTVVKQMTLDEITAEMTLRAELPDLSPADPAYRSILAGGYRELMLRQDADDQCRGVMLATAVGADLDYIGETYYRHPDGSPVLRLAGESDPDYRSRLQDSPEGLSVAGPPDAYEFNARSAHPNIKQAKASSPAPVEVVIRVLGRAGDGTVPPYQCELVDGYLWTRRPFTDAVTVLPVEIVPYRVRAKLWLHKTHDPDRVVELARSQAQALVDLKHAIKGRLTGRAVCAVLMPPGVDDVALEGWQDVVCDETQAPYCTELVVEFAGWADE